LAINSIFFIIVVYQVYRKRLTDNSRIDWSQYSLNEPKQRIHSNTRAGIWRVTRAVYYLIPLFNILHILEITDTNFFRVVYTPYGTPFFSLVKGSISSLISFLVSHRTSPASYNCRGGVCLPAHHLCSIRIHVSRVQVKAQAL